MTQGQSHPLPFNPESLPRETLRHYISATDEDIQAMMQTVGITQWEDLYAHIPEDSRFSSPPELPEELSYEALQERLIEFSRENRIRESYIGDGLPHYEVMPVVGPVCDIRNLTTAYTPYQPERSQGTLMTHWIYQCMMSSLTGFEAINSSLYDRSTAIFEAMGTAVRLQRKGETIVISEGIYPGDREVVETLLPGTGINVEWIPIDLESGRTDIGAAREALEGLGEAAAGFIFPHINSLGLLEDVDALADLTLASKAFSVAIIDPVLLGTGGLKPPTEFGQQGVDMIVGEAHHLAIGPNFGGPGLGLFGVRYNDNSKNAIRQTPGRYVGKARDVNGRNCLVMVLSTREQHIRKDKATSNICSNQAFLATIAGAAILNRGESGMKEAFSLGRSQAVEAASSLCALSGVELAFPEAAFVNEFVLELERAPADVIEEARQAGLHLGVDISSRLPGDRRLLKLSFSDRKVDIDKLVAFFNGAGFARAGETNIIPEIPPAALRPEPVGLPEMSSKEVIDYYRKLG
ncbi:MAG: glycine dehydrogenase, partial [Puniceicoccaceae bacterium]